MGASCSNCNALEPAESARTIKKTARQESPDPVVYDLMRRSVAFSTNQGGGGGRNNQNVSPNTDDDGGQGHLLFKHQKKDKPVLDMTNTTSGSSTPEGTYLPPTRLLVRRHSLRHYEEGLSGTHIYALRFPHDQPMLAPKEMQEQAQPSPSPSRNKRNFIKDENYKVPATKEGESVDHLFRPSTMAETPKQQVVDWVTVSEEHSIYIADVALTPSQCDRIIQVTEHVCRGQYAAYTYAKQTLGCREFPALAAICQPVIHTMTHAILEFSKNRRLALDDREPHMVKYDVTKKERQKLDMHTDKSEWTFLIALSNGSGIDYEGGGTYFECLDATVHLQRGHALVFPGKLRHCGQRITSGLRFLLVAFLVDKTGTPKIKEEDGTSSYHVNIP